MKNEIEKFKVNDSQFIINNSILVTTVDDYPVHFTGAEFNIMNYLLHHPSQLISKQEFEKRVLNLVFDRDGNVLTGAYSVYSHIASIRRKLNQIKQGLGRMIVTRRRLGYYLSLDDGSEYKH